MFILQTQVFFFFCFSVHICGVPCGFSRRLLSRSLHKLAGRSATDSGNVATRRSSFCAVSHYFSLSGRLSRPTPEPGVSNLCRSEEGRRLGRREITEEQNAELSRPVRLRRDRTAKGCRRSRKEDSRETTFYRCERAEPSSLERVTSTVWLAAGEERGELSALRFGAPRSRKRSIDDRDLEARKRIISDRPAGRFF